MSQHLVQLIHDYRSSTVRAFCDTCFWQSSSYKFVATAERWRQKHLAAVADVQS